MAVRHPRGAILAAVLIGVAALAVTGCDGAVMNGLYLLDTPRISILRDEFEWIDDGRWVYGPESQYGPFEAAYGSDPATFTYEIQENYYVAYGGAHYLSARNAHSGDVELIVNWEIFDAHLPGGEDNLAPYDYRIVLDTTDSQGSDPQGPTVELKLYDQGLPAAHHLRIREGVATASKGTSDTDDPPTPFLAGTLRVVFELHAAIPTITASVVDSYGNPVMETSLEVADGWPEQVHLFVEAAGALVEEPGPPVVSFVEPRAMDSLFLFRREEP